MTDFNRCFHALPWGDLGKICRGQVGQPSARRPSREEKE